MSARSVMLTGAAVSLLAPLAHGADLTITAGAEFEWTDNVFASSSERRNDLVESLTFGADAEDSEASYSYNIGYQMSHERYERDSFAAENYYTGDASLLWFPLPGRFDWRFEVASEVTQRSSQGALTPDNRDQRTTYSTAPRLVLFSTPRDMVYIGTNASKVTFREDDGNDSDRFGGTVGWLHTLSSLTALVFMTNHEEINFEDVEDYQRSSYSFGVNRQINGGSVSIAAGQTELVPEESETRKGMNATGNIEWSNLTHSLSMVLSRDLTDTSSSFGGWAEGGDFTPGDVNTGELALVTRTRISLADVFRVSPTLEFSMMVYSESEKSDDDTTDIDRKGTSLRATKSLSIETSVRAEYSYERDDDLALNSVERTSTYRLALDKRYGSRVTVSGWVRREASKSDVDDFGYEVHAVGVSGLVSY